jgi:hypothetical protein
VGAADGGGQGEGVVAAEDEQGVEAAEGARRGDRSEIAAVERAWVRCDQPQGAGADPARAWRQVRQRARGGVRGQDGGRRQGHAVEDDARRLEIETVAGHGEDELAERLAAARAGARGQVAASAAQAGEGCRRTAQHEIARRER